MSDLPTVTSQIPRDLRQFLDRVRETLNARGEEEVVTIRRLVAAGLADYSNGRLSSSASGGTQYGTPPAPTGLAVSGALGNIVVSWDAANYPGHAYTEVWAAQADGAGDPDLGEAELVGMAPGSVWAHNIGAGGTRWYWVRFINIEGLAGPYNAVDGVEGATSASPSYLLELLQGEITESLLNTRLSSRIDLIDADASVANSVAARIASVQSQVSELLNLPTWSSTTTYSTDEQVVYNGFLYVALRSSVNVRPDTGTTYWRRIGEYATIGDAVAAHAVRLGTLEGQLAQEVTDRTALGVRLDDSISSLDTRLTSQASNTSANADAITSLTASVSDNNTAQTAALTEEQRARAAADASQVRDINTLQATVTTNNNEQTAAVQAEATARAAADGVLEAQYTVKVDVNGYVSGYGLASTTVNGSPASEFIVRADAFAIGQATSLTPSVTPAHPFTVRTRSATLNGVSVPAGVYVQDAFIANGSITNAKIGDAAIDSAKIASAAVTSAKIARAAVTSAAIDTASVGRAKIADAAIDSAKIASAAVTNAKIANAAVDNAKIANLDAGKINAGTLDAARVAAGSLSADKIDTRGLSIKDTSGNVILSSGVPLEANRVNGLGNLARVNQITPTNAATYIQSLSVDTLQLADQAVTTPLSAVVQPNRSPSGIARDFVSVTANWGTADAPGVVQILGTVSFQFDTSSDSEDCLFYVRVKAVQAGRSAPLYSHYVYQNFYRQHGGSVTIAANFPNQSGQVTYSLAVSRATLTWSGTRSVSSASILVLGVRK